MLTFSKWLDNVCELACLPKKNFVQFGRWFVNDQGDMVAYTGLPKFSGYTIYRSEILQYEKFREAEDALLGQLKGESWMSAKTDIEGFRQALNLAWSKLLLTDKSDPDYLLNRNALNQIEYGRGIPCATECLVPEYVNQTEAQKENLRNNEDTRIILEFSEEQQCFNYNSFSKEGVPGRGGSISYASVAETTWHTAAPFTRMMKSRMYNGAILTFNQVLAEWNYYVFLLINIHSNIEAYGMFKKPSQEDMIRIGKRINIYDGEYAENEMMKLRRIGVPKIRE